MSAADREYERQLADRYEHQRLVTPMPPRKPLPKQAKRFSEQMLNAMALRFIWKGFTR